MRLLFVENDGALPDDAACILKRAGFAVDRLAQPDDATSAVLQVRYDALVLDRRPSEGLPLLRRLRQSGRQEPVLVLTAHNRPADRVEGLNAGADDCLARPFEADELVARVRALTRRRAAALEIALNCGNVQLDTAARSITVDGKIWSFSRRETAILELLMRRARSAIAREQLEDALYGFEDAATPNALEVQIHRLRKRLARAGATAVIETIRGVGYMISEK